MNESPAADAAPPKGFAASTFRALQHRNYRLFFGGQGLSLFGTWMTLVATRWLVYEKMPGQDWILGVRHVRRTNSHSAGAARRGVGRKREPASHAGRHASRCR